MTPDEKAGDSVPTLTLSAERLGSDDCARVTFMVYVLVVVPLEAVTTVVIAFNPTISGMLAEAVPDATAVPLTVMVDVAAAAVGVTVMEATELATDAE